MTSLQGPPRLDMSPHELGRMERDLNFWGIMNSLRVNGRLCDILLSVTGDDGSDIEYPAHKVILAASSRYFATNMDVLATLTMHKLDISELGLKAALDIIYRQDIPKIIVESNEVKEAFDKLKIFLPCYNNVDKLGHEHQMPFLAELALGLVQPYGGHHLDSQAHRNRDIYQGSPDINQDHLEQSKIEAQCWNSLPHTQPMQTSHPLHVSESVKSTSTKNYLSLEPSFKSVDENNQNVPPEKQPCDNNPETKDTKPAETTDVNPDKFRITRSGTIRKQDIEGSSMGSRRKETCQMCGKVYSHSNILRHIWKVHQCGEKTHRRPLRPKKLPGGSKSSVSCDICEKRFVRMYSLQMHVGIQHGIKFSKYRELQKINKLPKVPANHIPVVRCVKRGEQLSITRLPPKRRRLSHKHQRMYHTRRGSPRHVPNTFNLHVSTSNQNHTQPQLPSMLAQQPQGSKDQDQTSLWNLPGGYMQQQFQNILGQPSTWGLWQAPPPQNTPTTAHPNPPKTPEVSQNASSRVKCQICEETFATRGSCTRHIARIHNNHRKYSCKFCGKKCFDTTDLKLHTQTHTGEKTHECSHCLKRFIQKGQLRLHIQSVHNEEKQRDKTKHVIDPNAAETFFCKLCSFKSKYKAYLKTHMTRKHSSDIPEITCSECTLVEADQCPEGWIQNDYFCYFFSEERFDFEDARKEECPERDPRADLASIATMDELQFLQNVTRRRDQSFWLGMKGVNRNYKWVDGTPWDPAVADAAWGEGEPDADDEECGHFNPDGTWNDDSCDNDDLGFICKINLRKNCVAGWMEYQGNCYLFSDEEDDFENADEDECPEKHPHARLASISNIDELTWLKSQVVLKEEEYWIGMKGNNKNFHWIDGTLWDTEVEREGWRPGQPDGNGEQCGFFYSDGKWGDDNCHDDDRRFLCKYPTQRTNLNCPPRWLEYMDFCYYFGTEQLDWRDSKDEECPERATGSTLASITTQTELNFLKGHVKRRKKKFWLGLTDEPAPWHWIDGSAWNTALEYNIHSGEPSGGDQHCGHFYEDGTWGDEDCDKDNEMSSLCKLRWRPSTLAPSTTPQYTGPTTVGLCPSGWKPAANSRYCYLFSSDRQEWQAALDMCKSYGPTSNLASIESLDELSVIGMEIAFINQHNFWLGMTDLPKGDGNYYWIDGAVWQQHIADVAWAEGQPDGGGVGDEHCGEMTRLGAWNDKRCSDRRPYICKQLKVGYTRPTRPTTTPESSTTTPAVTSSPPTPTAPIPKCPQGWKQYHTFCYFFSEERDDFEDAREDECPERDPRSDLASIATMGELEFLGSEVRRLKQEFWLGMKGVNRKYRWVDGTPWDDTMAYLSWKPGEPDGKGEQCGHFNSDGTWSDDECKNDKRNFLCKFDVNQACEAGWMEYQGNCYLFSDEEDDFKDADEDECPERHPRARLASIEDESTLIFLKSEVEVRGKEYWIGMKGNNKVFTWIDGTVWDTAVEQDSWRPGQPDGNGEQCGFFYSDGKWGDDDCDNDDRRFLCKYPTQRNNLNCPPRWLEYRENCYFFGIEKDDWRDSDTLECPERDPRAKLASIVTQDELDFLKTEVKRLNKKYWIGMTDVPSPWHWSDGSSWNPALESNFRIGEPSGGNQHCGHFYEDGTWGDEECDKDDEMSFMCKLRWRPVTTTPTLPFTGSTTEGVCPYGWTIGEPYCYLYSTDIKEWQEARDMCSSVGATLASVESMEELAVLKMGVLVSETYYWLGMTDNPRGDKNYYWIDGTTWDPEVARVAWKKGQPDGGSRGDEHCGEFTPDGFWNDQQCDDRRRYICKKLKLGGTSSTKHPSTQTTESTIQTTQSTKQTTQPTPQTTQPVKQTTQSTKQTTQSTRHTTQSTRYTTQSTRQTTQSTRQVTETIHTIKFTTPRPSTSRQTFPWTFKPVGSTTEPPITGSGKNSNQKGFDFNKQGALVLGPIFAVVVVVIFSVLLVFYIKRRRRIRGYYKEDFIDGDTFDNATYNINMGNINDHKVKKENVSEA
ncbi:unnamed protein product [Owenia fusiformis]|uniref:Macrophage mannose receptor 1-like n=1 Tax=Owenia fusiformis TaxID=6347 RepID=A0A8S4NG21_OWEFU|nr:unnamed protein product [Owenia fusiformis]